MCLCLCEKLKTLKYKNFNICSKIKFYERFGSRSKKLKYLKNIVHRNKGTLRMKDKRVQKGKYYGSFLKNYFFT